MTDDISKTLTDLSQPSQRYHQLVEAGDLDADPKQIELLPYFDDLYDALLARHRQQQSVWTRWLPQQQRPVRGLYLWGGVGIGKTQLMDIFYDVLPFENKRRLHFHEFMRQIHIQLTAHQGQVDPLRQIAKKLSIETQVLCFDEFVVDDITDALLLAGLFKGLFAEGVCLVATSNVRPNQLYQGGLQRDLFLPAITLIETNTLVIHCDSDTDHRLLHDDIAGVFYTPLDKEAARQMATAYDHYSGGARPQPGSLHVCDRDIATLAQSDGVVWFEFLSLCGVPRSQNDYLAIAEQFQTVLVSNVPVISGRQYDLICNFIHLIDILYDQKIRLILSAASGVSDIYTTGRFRFQFARVQSRLLEMQSHDYYDEFSNRG